MKYHNIYIIKKKKKEKNTFSGFAIKVFDLLMRSIELNYIQFLLNKCTIH